jgi:acetyltransferase
LRLAAEANEAAEPVPVELPPAPFTLSEAESKVVLRAADVSTTIDRLFRPGEPMDVTGLSAPFVLKIVSRDIPHKTEVGGVRVNVGAAEVQRAAADLLKQVRSKIPGARIEGVLVSEMVVDGFELLLGTVCDAAFGPVVVLGMGGIYAEALGDRTCRLAPVNRDDAHAMIAELGCSSILHGMRGQPPFDLEALARMIVNVSRLAWAKREAIGEIDVNPVFVRAQGRGAVAADALIVSA